MTRITEASITGDIGEFMAASLLARIATVNPFRKDIGLDFHCELCDEPSFEFYVQAKGSKKPCYSRIHRTISSLPVECKTVEEYWLPKKHPVFVLMSDATTNRTYYTVVDPETTYIPTRENQKEYTFSIPLSNEITRDNVGSFVSVVIERQPGLSQEKLEHHLEEHYQKHPELYHDLDEIDRFLEVMRGSDQTAQAEVKLLLNQRFEAGMPIAARLEEGLKAIFINCKDSTTQHHVLDILLILNDRAFIPQVLKQIERNMRLYEFKPYGYEKGRSTYTDFLFAALVKLKATHRSKELRRFLNVKDTTINRGAIRACGELGINGAISDILRFLGHPDDGVRHDAAQALSKLDSNKVIPKLETVLRTSQDKLKIAGTIRTLAELKNAQVEAVILPLADDPRREVRKAVAFYLGAINPVEHINLLLRLMMDNDHKVRSEAMRSVHKCLPLAHPDELETPGLFQGPTITAEELEQLALPLLKEAYANRQISQVISLLSICKGRSSLPTLLDIYFSEESRPKKIGLVGPSGEVEGVQFVDLKASVLDILKQYDLPELHADIVEQIESSPANHKYIMAAGELKIDAAFMPLVNLISQESLEDRGPIVSSLASIDSAKAQAWAIDTLKTNPSLEVSLTCIDILRATGADEQERDLIIAQIQRLMNDVKVRRDPRVYHLYVGHYEVGETIPLIVKDLETEFDTLGVVKYRMLEIVMGLDAPKGRDVMIKVLPVVDDGWKHIIIQCLGEIGDSESMEAIAEYRDYPNLQISKFVENILSET